MTEELAITNARLVLSDRVIDGSLLIRDGVIAEIDEGTIAAPSALDLEGDHLLPGLVELHTDNLEKHSNPRPGVRWPIQPALLAHDAQLAAAGITTVFDALAIGYENDGGERSAIIDAAVEGLEVLGDQGILRIDHRLHLRCEVGHERIADLVSSYVEHEALGLLSLMDHTPGQRQFADAERYRSFYKASYGLTEDELERQMQETLRNHQLYSAANRRAVAALARERGLPLASHDDETDEHVVEAEELGVTLSEFPTTMTAARAAKQRGLLNIMGGPNVVRGGSHSGNVSARELAEEDLLSALSSDYMPVSLLHGALILEETAGMDLPAAVAMITKTPAEAVGLDDRGALEAGRRADLLRVTRLTDAPVIRQVWRQGQRII